MTVVLDAGPIHYLVLLGRVELLPVLFKEIALTPIVRRELASRGAPEGVRSWAESPPAWITLVAPAVPGTDLHVHPARGRLSLSRSKRAPPS